jgi:hypothetical protein
LTALSPALGADEAHRFRRGLISTLIGTVERLISTPEGLHNRYYRKSRLGRRFDLSSFD